MPWADGDLLNLANMQNKTSQVFNVKDEDYGAVGDGTTDDTSAIQAAIDAAEAASGGIVIGDLGDTYLISSQLTVTVSRVVLVNLRLNIASIGSDTAAVSYSGSLGATNNLTSDAAIGDTTLSVTDGTAFSAGDWALLSSTATTGATSVPKGEIVRVDSISSNDLTIRDPLCDSYATADTATVRSLTMLDGVGMVGCEMIGNDTAATTRRGVDFLYCTRPFAKDSYFQYCNHAAVMLQQSVQGKLSGLTMNDSLNSGLGYGVLVRNATQDLTISNCAGANNRHLVTLGGQTSSVGVPRRILVTGCEAHECRDAGFDSHAGPDDVNFIGNTVIGAPNEGIMMQGASFNIQGNTIRNSNRGIRIQNRTSRPISGSVIGNNITRCDDRGIHVDWDTSYMDCEGLIIAGNVISFCTAGGIESEHTHATLRFQNLTVVGNSLSNGSAGGILVRGGEFFTVTGNTIRVSGSGNHGIRALTSEDGVIAGNTVDGDGTNGVGLRFTTVSGAVVTGNRVNDMATGLHLENTCSACLVGDNDLTGNTTPLNIGTDTTHTINGLGQESANAETPTAASWRIGDIVDFTDSGDASGDGVYQLMQDGTTWTQLG